MNLIVLTQADFTSEQHVVLRDERFLHIRNIHQSTIGDTVRVGKLNELMGSGLITAIDEQCVTLQVQFDHPPPEKLPVTVILALPRPKMIRRIFRTLSELGVKELIIINSYKVEKSFWKSPAIEESRIQQYLISGLQQAKDTVLPTITFKRLFKPFVEDELPQIIAGTTALVAHPGTGNACPHSINRPITLAIGPEGGFTEYEANKFIECGFEGVHLGDRILRVENALTALISKLYL